MIRLSEIDIKKLEKSVDSLKDPIKLRLIKLNKHLDLLKGQQQYQMRHKDVKGFEQGQKELNKLYAEKELLMKKYSKLGKVQKKINKRYLPKKGFRAGLQRAITAGEEGFTSGLKLAAKHPGKVGIGLATLGLVGYAAKKRKERERY